MSGFFETHCTTTITVIYVKKTCSVYIQCKGDIVVVDIKQHKSQFNNSNFTITQSAKFF